MTLTPGLLAHALRARGLPQPHGFGDAGYIRQLGGDERKDLLDLVLRLNNGSDHPGDMDSILKLQSKYQDGKQSEAALENGISAENRIFSPDPVDTKFLRPPTKNVVPGLVVERRSHHVYGKSCSLCIEPVEMGGDRPYSTLLFDIAPILDGTRYDWENKVQFRLTSRELPFFAALMMGWVENVSFDNHGRLNDKSMMVTDQKKHIFLRIHLKPKTYAIQIPPEEIFPIAAMTTNVLISNNKNIDSQTLMMMIKRSAGFKNAQV